MASTLIKSINFYWDHHLNNLGLLHLEKELSHYWKDNKVDLNWDKHKPHLSIENLVKFIEKTSNMLVDKIDYFLIKEIHLTSNETHKKLVKETLKRTIALTVGGGRATEYKTYKQQIHIINSDKSRTQKRLNFLENHHNKIQDLNQLGIQLYRDKSGISHCDLGGEYHSELTHIHKLILDEKESHKKVMDNWQQSEKYKWNIIDIKSKIKDTFD
tara:strand:+ start:908 stop:1549 length:642 start_codon:yes stop_codon:yes gene_type:complete